MPKHMFRMRLSCGYKVPDIEIDTLDVEVFEKSGWQVLDLRTKTAGFLVFVYAIFTCQHLYLRTNAKERGLTLKSSTGAIEVWASEDWALQKLHVQFEIELESGEAKDEDLAWIQDRMRQCPVSINLGDIPDSQTLVQLKRNL